jgi:hypothetical protein
MSDCWGVKKGHITPSAMMARRRAIDIFLTCSETGMVYPLIMEYYVLSFYCASKNLRRTLKEASFGVKIHRREKVQAILG